ncbi:MAG: hypothetical protein SWJ54_17630 [Cyanobacteriota bacterium]|nr:hypothetical protein [Cyanobacteriota bacterium]
MNPITLTRLEEISGEDEQEIIELLRQTNKLTSRKGYPVIFYVEYKRFTDIVCVVFLFKEFNSPIDSFLILSELSPFKRMGNSLMRKIIKIANEKLTRFDKIKVICQGAKLPEDSTITIDRTIPLKNK